MDQPLSARALVELVHRYYPTNLLVDEPGYYESEQFQRLVQLREAATRERWDAWGALCQRVREALPGCFVQDWTYLRHDNCHRIRAYTPDMTPDAPEVTAVMACVSILAPIYLLYTSYQKQIGGKVLPPRLDYDSPPVTQRIESVIESEIQKTFGFTRLPKEVLFTPVPDIKCGNVMLGKATLADCLFTDDRW